MPSQGDEVQLSGGLETVEEKAMEIPEFSLDIEAIKESKKPDPSTVYDLLILGGGPAAMSATVYAARKMLNLAIITKDFGGQMLETSNVENWLGFQSIDARDLLEKFQEHIKNFDISVALGSVVEAVAKDDGTLTVTLDNGVVHPGKAVIVATGKRHRRLDVPGEHELTGRGVAYCATCDAPLYKGKKVVVAGGGNSAFTTALDLLKVGADVTMVQYSENWRADLSLQERVKQFHAVRFLGYYQILRIEGENRVTAVAVKNRKTDEEEIIRADGVFVEIGLISNSHLVKDIVELNRHGEIEIDSACRTNVEGLFSAGDVTTVPFKQLIISAGEGAKAALAAYDYLVAKHLI
jgi:alkyl hydroperoxide reductase subunit F